MIEGRFHKEWGTTAETWRRSRRSQGKEEPHSALCIEEMVRIIFQVTLGMTQSCYCCSVAQSCLTLL